MLPENFQLLKTENLIFSIVVLIQFQGRKQQEAFLLLLYRLCCFRRGSQDGETAAMRGHDALCY